MLMHLLLLSLPALVLSTVVLEMAPATPVLGKQLVFTCTTDGTNVQIKKDTSNVGEAGSKSYTITALALTDSGEYKCIADISGTLTESDPKTIDDSAVGEITISLDPSVPVEGSALKMTCASTDATTYAFTKDGAAYTEGVDGGELTWTTYTEADNKGTYTCVASATNKLAREATKEVTSSADHAKMSVLLITLGMLLGKSLY